ncbi:MAG: hypothetical protein WA688_08225 [Thermoplasmata archaeon]
MEGARRPTVILLAVLLASLLALPLLNSPSPSATVAVSPPRDVRSDVGAASPSPGAFALVSTFEDLKPDGWRAAQGTFTVQRQPNYAGEPALVSSAEDGPQLDVATHNVVAGQTFLSLQGVIHPGPGATGFIGLGARGKPVLLIGLGAGQVWAGPSLARLSDLGPIPIGSAQPNGWTYVTANIYQTDPSHSAPAMWEMDVFVDQTAVPMVMGFSVPAAGKYTEALILTTQGRVAYSDYILTTYEIAEALNAQFAPNPSDGYGQGSGVLVTLLPRFNILTSTIQLDNWNVPRTGILSVQIDAMNPGGANYPSCHGFYQLGVDLDPQGHIAPWYVPKNCNPFYFQESQIGVVSSGFVSPPDTVLSLTIARVPSEGEMVFTLVDHNVRAPDAVWSAAIPYTGPAFVAAYTQIEWQATSRVPVSQYFFNGSFAHLRISGQNLSAPVRLGPEYMIPFAVGVPPSWNFFYYNRSDAGYSQVG